MDTSERVVISVVVIGRNEGERLARCLESIRRADWPADRLELIYSDSGSTDESRRIATELGARVIETKEQRPTAAAARNDGIRAATSELVHVFDGDTIVDPHWFAKAVKAIAPQDVVCVFGQRRELDPRRNVYHFWADQDWGFTPGPTDFSAGDALYKRSALLRVGGFDSTLIAGEDPDLAYRLAQIPGAQIVGVGEPMTIHDIGISRFGQYWRRCVRSGWAYAEVSARHPDMRLFKRVVRRNLVHLGALCAAVLASFAVRGVWPLALWMLLIAAAIARDAARCTAKVGTRRGALLLACHHYLSKLPAVIGHLQYYWSRIGKPKPRGLIEYRDADADPSQRRET